jgi:hypothetical protein
MRLSASVHNLKRIFCIAGFATHVAFLGTTNAFPESKHRDRQLIMSQQSVFGLDALQSSKAITSDVTNPDYDSYFGAIAYQKGEFN